MFQLLKRWGFPLGMIVSASLVGCSPPVEEDVDTAPDDFGTMEPIEPDYGDPLGEPTDPGMDMDMPEPTIPEPEPAPEPEPPTLEPPAGEEPVIEPAPEEPAEEPAPEEPAEEPAPDEPAEDPDNS